MRDPNQKITTFPSGQVHVETVNTEPSLTQQQFIAECDVNNIIKKFSTTGEFTHLTSKQGRYADFSNITDYREMLETVMYAQDAFAALPAEVRLRFSNDPGKLLEFIQDDKNRDEALKLGLLNASGVGNDKIKNNLNNNNDSSDPAAPASPKNKKPLVPPKDSTPPQEE